MSDPAFPLHILVPIPVTRSRFPCLIIYYITWVVVWFRCYYTYILTFSLSRNMAYNIWEMK